MQVVLGVLTNLCPKCHEGHVFAGLMRMNAACPRCGLVFEREPGYFTGATTFSYGFGFFLILPLFMFMLFRDVPLYLVVLVPGIQLVLMAPFLYRFARLTWLHLDHRFQKAER